MRTEIERKFFVTEMPDLSSIRPKHYERYFLQRGNSVETRISKVDDVFVIATKRELSHLERTVEKRNITQAEFDLLKMGASEVILRDRYEIATDPDIAIQIYHGRFEGLVRAEVEFKSLEEAEAFEPLPWMGREMSALPLARDARLLDLDAETFKQLVASGR
jgi:adenylate cyclase